MDLGSILLFVAAIGIANATPGPTIATFLARLISMGASQNVGFAIGLVLGDVLWMAAAVFGLAALAAEAHAIMVVLKYLGAAYILYLAYRMWTAPAAEPMAHGEPTSSGSACTELLRPLRFTVPIGCTGGR